MIASDLLLTSDSNGKLAEGKAAKRAATRTLQLLSCGKVAAKLGVCQTTVYALIAKHGFPKPLRVGPVQVRWLEHEVEAWIEAEASKRPARPEEEEEGPPQVLSRRVPKDPVEPAVAVEHEPLFFQNVISEAAHDREVFQRMVKSA